jgi:hypothetical protein
MKNSKISTILLCSILIFSIISCSDNKEVKLQLKELIKLDEITEDSTDKAMHDSTELVSDYGGNESSQNATGNTRMTMYVTKKDNIHFDVQNVTGNYISGFKPWNEGYDLEFGNASLIKDDKGIGIVASIAKSEKGTTNINYNIKYLYEDSTVYVVFFGGPTNLPWKQWDYFHFKNPEKALAIMKTIESKLK